MTALPKFLILREPFFYTVQGDGIPLTRVHGDLATLKGRERFIGHVSTLHPDLADPDALAAIRRAVKELAHGQPAAGTVTDEVRECIRAVASEIRKAPSPAKKRRRQMTPAMEETLCGAVDAPTYDPLDNSQGGGTWPKTR